jgi:hypothetical protein
LPRLIAKNFEVEGDIRHGIQTVARLPDWFAGTVTFTVSNSSMDMTARNIFLTMLAFLVPDKEEAVDAMIHLWYSAYLKPCHVRLLMERIRPFIADAARIVASRPQEAIFTRSLIEDDRGVRISLTAAQWVQLLHYFDFAEEDGDDESRSATARNEVVASETFNDERDLILLRNSAHTRVGIMKFREQGILQPFSHTGREFTIPNPYVVTYVPMYGPNKLTDLPRSHSVSSFVMAIGS